MPFSEELAFRQLRKFQELHAVPDEQLHWLIRHGACKSLKEGEFLFQPDEPIIQTYFMLSGSVELYYYQGKNKRSVMTYETGGIIGYLPYSRAQKSIGYAVAQTDTEILLYPRSKIHDLITQAPELTEELVHHMVSRVRQFTSQTLQNEKMLALGKLSAGLAHELNNPIAAIHRDAHQLGQLVHQDQLSQLVLKCTGLSDELRKELIAEVAVWRTQENRGTLKPMERSRAENAWEETLEEWDIADPEDAASAFTDFGLIRANLEPWKAKVNTEQFPLLVNWVSYLLQTKSLVNNIQSASSRVNVLIGAVKSYTHMDRAQEKQAVDIFASLQDTLMILSHKIKSHNITVTMPSPSEPISLCGYVGELNQVWTNVIDNALDAMETAEEPVLRIDLSQGKDSLTVSFTDNGTGIPEEDLPRIFDPFFTTKEIGKGTGMGLDLVHQIIQKHDGKITVESTPGNTRFTITLPTD